MLQMVSITMTKPGAPEKYLNSVCTMDGTYRILNGDTGLTKEGLINSVNKQLSSSKIDGYSNRIELAFSGDNIVSDFDDAYELLDLQNIDTLNINIRRVTSEV